MTLQEVLRGGRQCDEDGVEIIMSRQACVEAADALDAKDKRIAVLERDLEQAQRNCSNAILDYNEIRKERIDLNDDGTLDGIIGAHDHGNCELCDQIESELVAAQDGWKREGNDADKLLSLVGLDPVRYRTEGGALMVSKAANAIKERIKETVAHERKRCASIADRWSGVGDVVARAIAAAIRRGE